MVEKTNKSKDLFLEKTSKVNISRKNLIKAKRIAKIYKIKYKKM